MRTDIHRPSVIKVEDYVFIAFEYLKIEELGDMFFLQEERKHIREHMTISRVARSTWLGTLTRKQGDNEKAKTGEARHHCAPAKPR